MSKRFVLIAMVISLFVSAISAMPVKAQTPVGDRANLHSENVPDDSIMNPGQHFEKCWVVENSGDTIWSKDYTFNYVSGESFSGTTSISLPSVVDRKNTVELCVNMVAPEASGIHRSVWQMKNSAGELFDYQMYVQIIVANWGINSNTSQQASTPTPNEFEYRKVDANSAAVYINDKWVVLTANPQNKYRFLEVPGTFEFFQYEECRTTWSLWEGFGEKCEMKQKYFRDLGIHPFVSYSKEGTLEFYSYMADVTGISSLSSFASIYNGTWKGVNGYQVFDLGESAKLTGRTLGRTLGAVSGIVLIVGFIHNAEKCFVITRPLTPVPVPTALVYTMEDIMSLPSMQSTVAIKGYVQKEVKTKDFYLSFIFSGTEQCSITFYLNIYFKFEKRIEFNEDRECLPKDLVEKPFEVLKAAIAANVDLFLIVTIAESFIYPVFEKFGMPLRDAQLIIEILRICAKP